MIEYYKYLNICKRGAVCTRFTYRQLPVSATVSNLLLPQGRGLGAHHVFPHLRNER